MHKNTGKIAFITGANRGIGFETARRLGEEGVTVILGARNQLKGEEAAKELKAMGLSAVPFLFDVDTLSDHEAIRKYIENNYGKLDILINNAGVLLENHAESDTRTASAVPAELLRKTFDTNFFNLISLTQMLLPLLKRSEAGRIVNLSSILASLTLHSDPKSPIYEGKLFAYDASKTALNAFTVHLAHELRHTRIKVNSAHPGWVKTEMGGPDAPLDLQEGAKTSVELALLPENGPTGGFYHLSEALPW